MSRIEHLFARLSLALLWLLTGVVSLTAGQSIGVEVLTAAGVDRTLIVPLIWAGSLLDLALGLWLLSGWALRLCCALQLGVVISYSILLSLLAPAFWLHPFGPLSKNLPILVLIWLLLRDHDKRTELT
ncbi:DoxX-like family protein [Halopseudomonas oceani]|uniref:DoxX-like family protein n=1 Tax=Halopseudomonas oceani TaxID=1708783 RepID=UPI002AA76B77|nr:DoxX-like family protein [Halopseudomonas oceani]